MDRHSATTGTLLKSPLPVSQIDDLLAAQLVVAWSGWEHERRLGD
jgi:hypothetical protein